MTRFDRSKKFGQGLVRCTALGLILGLMAGCSTPIGVVRGTTQDTYRSLTANVLSSGKPSTWSTQVLQRSNMIERYDDDPAGALLEMRKTFASRVTPDRLFALSELSFHYAEESGKKEHYLAAAVYAYAFLFPEDGTPQPDPLDPRRRLAADLYNLGLIRSLDTAETEEVTFEDGKLALPFGEMELSVDRSSYLWGGFRFKRFVALGNFEVRGFSNRYRQPGIGAPLAAELEPVDAGPQGAEARKRIPPLLKVPVTAFVQIDEPRRASRRRQTQGQAGDLRRRPYGHRQPRRPRGSARTRTDRRARLHARGVPGLGLRVCRFPLCRSEANFRRRPDNDAPLPARAHPGSSGARERRRVRPVGPI